MAGVVHMSEAEAARNFAAVMQRVRAGDEVVVEDEGGPAVVMRSADRGVAGADRKRTRIPGRTAAEAIETLRTWESENGPLRMGADFADDVEEGHARLNQPLDASKWD